MELTERVAALIGAGVAEAAGVSADWLRTRAGALDAAADGVLCVHPALVRPSVLAGLLRLDGRPGFVVEDMVDLDEFVPLPGVEVPDGPLYLAVDVERGDDLLDQTPNAAVPELLSRGRSPLTISEGISWLLQEPGRLEPNRCFMCAGSVKPRGQGRDPRTPAIWISRGTGRDGAARRGAPKVGWCWAGNHHSWLGFASAARRSG